MLSSNWFPLAVLRRLQDIHAAVFRRIPRAVAPLLLLGFLSFVPGCERFHPQFHREMVYVSARGNLYLHDRVAVVSNRVAQVQNGEPLEVIERVHRFLRVKTQQGQEGWIEESAVVDSTVYDGFEKLAETNKDDPIIATGTLDDELYMHILPGRATQHFYLLPAKTKVELLARASAPKSSTPPPPALAQTAKPAASDAGAASSVPGLPQPAPPAMEDWWLARDTKGHTGWMLASRIYVNVPDSIAQYCEGQQIVGAYVLKKVVDPEADYPNHEVPEYLTLEAPLGSGRPNDFSEVRIFTWSLRHHRYETAFRLRPIAGFFPVRTGMDHGKDGSEIPTFSFQIAANENLVTDPATGITRPASPRTIEYQMIDTVVKRTGADTAPIPLLNRSEKKQKEQVRHRRR